jgi:phage-related protein
MVALAMIPGLLRAILPLFTGLADLLRHPFFAQLAVDVITFVVAAKGVIAVLALVGRAFALLGLTIEATPIGWIITAIAAIVIGFYELWEHCAAFRNFWEGLWRDIQSVMAPVVAWIRQVVANMSRWWTDHGHTVVAVLRVMWAIISTDVKLYLGIIETAIKVGLILITAIFKASWAVISAVVVAAWQVIHTIVYVGVHSIYDIIAIVLDLIHGHWSAAWHALMDLARTQMNGIVSIIRSIASGFGKILFQAGADLIHGLIGGIESAVGGLLSTVGGLAGNISGVFSSVLHILSPSKVFAEHGRNIVLGLIQGLQAGTGQVQSTMNAIAGMVGSYARGSQGAVYGAYAASASAPAAGPAASAIPVSGNLIIQVNGQTLFEIAKSELYKYNIRNSGQVTGVAVPAA